MCILCLASRWSRRIVTLLPWLIIPLIILWALSQLLPSEFQFEVTSPRLACVGVLLVSLGWYELAMPRLTTWRARRSAYLKERRRLEVQEAAKWRKEATRLCRNCSSPYRDQTPACGKFICTFCGHMSRRPVLDVPPSTVNATGNKGNNVASAQSPPCGGYTCDTRGNQSIDTGEWLGQKACGGDVGREETLADGRRGEEQKEDDADNRKGSRGEKARRKAEEKRLARLAREQMEADERRQREEVTRLVEERRRLRDEKIEAERVSEREVAAERDKELRQEGESERRRHEKLKKRETTKDKPGIRDAVEDTEKDRKRRDCKLKSPHDQKSNDGSKKVDTTRTVLTAKESIKLPVKPLKTDLCTRGTDTKTAGSSNAGRCSQVPHLPSSNSKMQNAIFSSTWDNSSVAAASPVKGSGSIGNASVKDTQTARTNIVAPSVQHLNTGCSAWKNMRWSNVWGKAASTTPFEVCATSPPLPSNFDLQPAACSDCLDQGDWFGGVHARGDNQRELNSFSDLDQEADMIIRVDPAHTHHVAPIGPQQAENFGSHSGKHASAMISEPWGDDFNRRKLDLDLGVHGGEAAVEDGNWKMWEAPQLDQIQLPCVKDSADPLSWMLPLGLSSGVASPIHTGVSAQLETQFSNYSSSLPHSSCPVSLLSTSLWSDQSTTNSFFSSTLQRPSGVGGSIPQERMDGRITLADDYFYEHSSVLPELQTYNTSLNPGECFAPFSDRGIGIDRHLPSDQSMASMQLRSAIHRETVELQESRSKWSMGIANADWSTLGVTNTTSSDTDYGGFYSAPSAPSLWSINAS